MKRPLYLIMTVVLLAIFSVANAQNVQCYGYARTCFNGESWQNKFVAFNTNQLGDVQAVSETLPEIWAATYLDGYVWYVTMMSRSLCKAPFNEETQTLGASETVVDQLEPYNLIIDMAYNPMDGMMYYLCQDSQYNSYLKCSSLANPSLVETIGAFSVKLWTLAINSQGQAYGVAYEGGNLYRVNLADAAATLVGPTGKDVWYTQSMAFDWETDELYWAQFATASDNGFYQVNTQTGAASALGEIGNGMQLTGLFMVSGTPSPCIAPTNLVVTTDLTDATITWDGNASSYTLRFKIVSESEWVTIPGIMDNTYYLTDLPYGEYDLEVQADCDEGNWIATTFTVSPPPIVINEIFVLGFTAPAWGEHPDYEVEVDPDSPYTITAVEWHRYVSLYDDQIVEPDEFFDLEDVNYYLFVVVTSKDGYVFGENPVVYFDGDNTVFDVGQLTYHDYRIYTIDYRVMAPTGIEEQTINALEGQAVSVYDITGRLVFQGCYGGQHCLKGLKPGVYVVNTAGCSFKLMIE